MKNLVKVVAVVVLALALCQTAMAAPTQGAYMATANSGNLGLFDHFLQLLGAIWGDNGAIWSGPGSSSGGRAMTLNPGSASSKGSTNDGAIWGRCTLGC